eukprot:6460296-Amphidinium_carterae.1
MARGENALSYYGVPEGCSRWLSGTRAGLQSVEDREKIEVFLEVLLAECMQSVEMQLRFSLGPHAEREGKLPVLSQPMYTLTLHRRGVTLASVPNVLLQHVPVHCLSPDEARLRFPVLLKVLYERKEFHWALEQICVQIGRFFERHLWKLAWTVMAEPASHRLEALRYNVQYLAAGKRSLSKATNLSLAVDASRVGKRKLLMGVVASSNPAVASIVPPQDT